MNFKKLSNHNFKNSQKEYKKIDIFQKNNF